MASSPPARSSTLLPPPRIASSPPSQSGAYPAVESGPPPSGRRRISSLPPKHEDLDGGYGSGVRFRPARLEAAELPANLVCTFRCDGAFVGPLTLVNLSAAGFGASAPKELALAPGSVLESLEISVGTRAIWSGDAVVVHGSGDRIGARFTSRVLDLQSLRLGATIERRLWVHEEQRERLPAAWRAAVADIRRLLEDTRLEMEDMERAESHDPLLRAEEEARLFEALQLGWGHTYYQSLAELHEMSKGFDERTTLLGRSYAASMLMPLLMACAIHRRAYEKPLGYAGDYRMMELYFADEFSGDGLFGRFLHSVMQNYTLGRAVRAREAVMRSAAAAAATASGDGPVRILAVAAGPAIELRRMLEEVATLRRPVELILLDQDRSAHESAHRHLTRILLERYKGMLPVSVQCLHFSVRQLLKPQTEDDRNVVAGLTNLDSIYSAGLYDYLPEPVAVSLTRLLYGCLRPGGRLLLGNLVETPDSTWMMNFVLGWPLLYRTHEAMLRLAKGLAPDPTSVSITEDATGQCLFLDVTSSS